MRKRLIHSPGRRGAAAVEMALVLPVFFLFIFSLIEFGHVFMLVNTLNAAAKQAARLGVADGVSTQEVTDRVQQILSRAIDTTNATVMVKSGATFEQGTTASNSFDYATLPDMELESASPRELFVVRIEVPYEEVALLPPFWVRDLRLYGQAVQRHE